MHVRQGPQGTSVGQDGNQKLSAAAISFIASAQCGRAAAEYTAAEHDCSAATAALSSYPVAFAHCSQAANSACPGFHTTAPGLRFLMAEATRRSAARTGITTTPRITLLSIRATIL